jgi:hypothetical protein
MVTGAGSRLAGPDGDVRAGCGVIQKDSAPWACSSAAIASESDRMPVTLEAAEKLPMRSGRSA